MRKIFVFVLIVILMFSCTSCSSVTDYGFEITESMVYVQGEDSIISIFVEDFNKKKYSEKELEKEIKNEVKEYNESTSDKKGLKFVNLDVTKSVATLELEFKSDNDYSAYNTQYVYYGSPVIFKIGSINELIKEQVDFSGEFKLVKKDDKSANVTIEELKKVDGLKVILANEGIKLRVKGDILYTSGNVSVKDGLATTTIGENNYIFYK